MSVIRRAGYNVMVNWMALVYSLPQEKSGFKQQSDVSSSLYPGVSGIL